jgi:predicted RNA binding protein YcfA (HicA-like mRNA interferase family)
MNGRLPAVTAGQVLRALERAGFTIVRTSGGHHRLVHRDDPSRATTVPVHVGKTLKRGTLRGIIKQAGLTVGEFRDLL